MMAIVDPFFDMHERIKHNDKQGFGGAAVIVFPQPAQGTAIDPIELLILDPKADLAQFIATLATKLQILKEEMDAQRKQGYR